MSIFGNVLGICWDYFGNVLREERGFFWEYAGIVLGICWEWGGNEVNSQGLLVIIRGWFCRRERGFEWGDDVCRREK